MSHAQRLRDAVATFLNGLPDPYKLYPGVRLLGQELDRYDFDVAAEERKAKRAKPDPEREYVSLAEMVPVEHRRIILCKERYEEYPFVAVLTKYERGGWEITDCNEGLFTLNDQEELSLYHWMYCPMPKEKP